MADGCLCHPDVMSSLVFGPCSEVRIPVHHISTQLKYDELRDVVEQNGVYLGRTENVFIISVPPLPVPLI